MWALKKLWYRIFQVVFGAGAHLLPWRKAEVVSGQNSISRIPALLKGMGVQKALVVTDPGLMKAGVAPKILALLEQSGMDYALFSEVEANPSTKTVEAAYTLFKTEQCNGIVAIGGGSAMDTAKGAGARAVKPNKTIQQLGGLLRVLHKLPPFIAVPTTAGTGSETTIAAVITDKETHHKYALYDLSLIPKYAVLDPALTLGLPQHITSTTGMDALTHAVEAYLCVHYTTKETRAFSEEAVQAIFRYLERAYENGADMEAREALLLASYKAGWAFTRAGVGNVHTIAHTLGGFYNTPHGLANAVILPYVLEDYGETVNAKLARLYDIAGLSGAAGEEAKAKAFIAEIRAMNARMHIPTGFDFIKDADIPQMIGFALKECNPLYPVPVLYNTARCRKVIERIRIPAAAAKA